MSTETAEKQSLDFELSQVPENGRKGFWAMLVVMLGFTFFSSSMWTGNALGLGLTFGSFWVAVLAGNLILGVYTALLAWVAADTGLSIHLLARRGFGVKGSWLPSFLLAFTQIGWFGVGVAMFAVPVDAWLKASGHECNIWIPVILSGIAFTASAYFGIKGLAIISIIAVPVIVLGGGFSAIKVFVDNPDAWDKLLHFTPAEGAALGLGTAIAMTVGNFASGGTCTPDFVRFAKNRKIAISTTAIAFFLGSTLMFVFGAVGAMFYGKNDISEILVIQNLLIPGILVLGLNIWTTNDNALYTSGLGLSNITGIPKKYIVIFNGLLGTLLAVWLYNNFCGWLSLLNNTLPPVGAVVITDFLLTRKNPVDLKNLPVIRFQGVIAWAAGVGVAFATKNIGISSINAIITTGIVYTLLSKCTCKAAKQEAILSNEGLQYAIPHIKSNQGTACMKKAVVFVIIGVVAMLFAGCFVSSGFQKISSGYILEYSVSEDGSEITLRFIVAAPVGYIRNVSVHRQEGGRLELDCYSAFGGINGSIGAKDTFTFQLKEDTTSIALYRNDSFYEDVLLKNENGVWHRKGQ